MRNFVTRSSFDPLVLALVATLLGAGSLKAEDAAPSDTIVLVLNKAKVLQLPPNAVTIIVGNPSVADVTMVKRSKHMVLTGKGFGETNLIALDAQGRSVGESVIRVAAPTRSLVVQRGLDRETWDCSPRCQPTYSLGDASKFATDNAAQIQARNGAVNSSQRSGGSSGF